MTAYYEINVEVGPLSGIVKSSAKTQAQVVQGATGARMSVLVGPEDGAPRYVTRKFTLDPGGRIPRHSHPDIEHEQYVLSGEMVLGLGEKVHTVKAGDAVFIPAQEPHWYENRSDRPVEFLCIVPKTDKYETDWLE